LGPAMRDGKQVPRKEKKRDRNPHNSWGKQRGNEGATLAEDEKGCTPANGANILFKEESQTQRVPKTVKTERIQKTNRKAKLRGRSAGEKLTKDRIEKKKQKKKGTHPH